jgi:hypothetical protein
MSAAANTIPTNALSKCVASIQVDMKHRIEEECRKQMMALLEDSFTQKWEEYTNNAVETASTSSLYTEGYGRLDLASIPNNGVWGQCPDAKTVLSTLQTMFEFSSKNVYFIHCCVTLIFSAPSWRMAGYFIDNYGFYYMIRADISPLRSAYPDKLVKIDVMKPVNGNQYVYPLSDALIDNVKALPFVVGIPHTNGSNYTELESLIKVLPSIRKTASIFYDQTVALDALRKENELLKEQLRKHSPSVSVSVSQQEDDLFDLFASCNQVLEFLRVCFCCQVVEGYGQTECAAAATTVHVDDHNAGE